MCSDCRRTIRKGYGNYLRWHLFLFTSVTDTFESIAFAASTKTPLLGDSTALHTSRIADAEPNQIDLGRESDAVELHDGSSHAASSRTEPRKS